MPRDSLQLVSLSMKMTTLTDKNKISSNFYIYFFNVKKGVVDVSLVNEYLIRMKPSVSVELHSCGLF